MHKADVHVYTDGAASGNPGPGGYGIVMEWVGTPYKKEFSQGFTHTTNNRITTTPSTLTQEKRGQPNMKGEE